MKPTLIQEVNQFCKNHIYRLNAGGCGFFALYMGEELQKKGEEFEILVIRDQECEGSMFFHILIEWNGQLFDGYQSLPSWAEWFDYYTKRNCFCSEIMHRLSYEDYVQFFNDIRFWSSNYPQEQNEKLKQGIAEKFDLWYVNNN